MVSPVYCSDVSVQLAWDHESEFISGSSSCTQFFLNRLHPLPPPTPRKTREKNLQVIYSFSGDWAGRLVMINN